MPVRPGTLELRALAMEVVADAVVVTEVGGTIVDVNSGFERVTGFEAAEVIGRHADVLMAVNQSERILEARRVILAGQSWQGELEFRHRSGHDYLGRVIASPLVLSGSTPTHVVSIHRDITAFRKTAEVQRRAAKNVQRLIERLPDAIAVVRDDVVLFANQAMVELVGRSDTSGLVGRSLGALIAEPERALALDRVRRVSRAEGSLSPRLGRLTASSDGHLEVRLLGRGRPVHVELALEPMIFDELPAVAVIARDLSALHQIDLRAREMERMIAIGTLSSGIAHEINTPIQYVGDSAQFLREAFTEVLSVLGRYRALATELARTPEALGALDEVRQAEESADLEYLEAEIPNALGRTRDGVERVARIVRALKEFGHPGSDSPAAADLDELIKNTVVVATNELKYVADVELDLGVTSPVVCFASAVNQVLLNLVVNAAHAVADRVRDTRDRGKIRIRSVEEGDTIHVTVEDSGTGIPEKVRPRIFDPFFTTKGVGRGTGQGLAIARSVVDRHGGRIWFETEEGVGTHFHFVLPISGPPAPSALSA